MTIWRLETWGKTLIQGPPCDVIIDINNVLPK